MSRLNPVYSAITDIDDSIILNAKKPRKRPLVIALAAAAAVLTLVGFTIANRYGVSINGEDAFDYRLTVQSVTIPSREEMEALGDVNQPNDHVCIYELKTLPSNIFKSFGISPLMNDNFSEEENVYSIFTWYTDDGELANITIDYTLTDKRLDKAVSFEIFLMTKAGAGTNTNFIVYDSDDVNIETIALNDGSECVIVGRFLGGLNIQRATAEFSYGGIAYSLNIPDGNNEDMKQILSDLGVL